MMSGGIAGMLLGILLWAGFFTLLVWAVYTIAVNLGAKNAASGASTEPPNEADEAEELLRQRFARGEIDAEEYERSLAVLRGDREKAGAGQ